MKIDKVLSLVEHLFSNLDSLEVSEKIDSINKIKLMLREHSPLKAEPVDCVLWVRANEVGANDYNPNSVAPPEMELLRHSILEDGYTQPIVTWINQGKYEVVDGFHRNRVGKESLDVAMRICGRLPVTVINTDRQGRSDRIASTIRHNRARGKHRVDGMSDIVIELKRRNWSDEKICRELGMDKDEVLRLCQITGLADLFSDQEFSKSWDVEGEVTDSDFVELTDDTTTYGEEAEEFRTVNTSDEKRIFHTYEKWECFRYGFYATTKEGMNKAECEEQYRVFLADLTRFEDALKHVISEWKNSCEHYLTNAAMNRIAWLGQAAACYAMGIPSTYRSGFFLLSEVEQETANQMALKYLNIWLEQNGREEVAMEEAYSGDRQSDIY